MYKIQHVCRHDTESGMETSLTKFLQMETIMVGAINFLDQSITTIVHVCDHQHFTNFVIRLTLKDKV